MLEERASCNEKVAGNRLAKLTQANKTAIFGFAEALELYGEKSGNAKPVTFSNGYFVNFNQSLLSPIFISFDHLTKKKGKD